MIVNDHSLETAKVIFLKTFHKHSIHLNWIKAVAPRASLLEAGLDCERCTLRPQGGLLALFFLGVS